MSPHFLALLHRRIRPLAVTVASAALAATTACAGLNATRLAPTRGDSTLALGRLDEALTSYWRRELTRDYELALANGVPISLIPDLSIEGRKGDLRVAQEVTAALDRVNVAALTQGDYVTSLALRWEMDAQAEAVAFTSADFTFLAPASSPVRTLAEVYRLSPMATPVDAQRYLYFVEALPFLLDKSKAALEERRARGYAAPREMVESALDFYRELRALGMEGPWALSPSRLVAYDATSQLTIQRELQLTVTERVQPALDDFIAYLDSVYRPVASPRPGLWQYPGGKELYRHLLRRHSSLDVPPEEAHRVGLGELQRIDASLAALRRQHQWNPSARAFHDSLRLAIPPAPSLDAVRARVAGYVTRISAGLPERFAQGPAKDAIVRPATRAEALLWPDGTYRPASAALDAGELLLTDRWRSPAVQVGLASRTYRALVPGRHLESAMTRGNPDLPAFRRHLETPGFADGWGQYAASLAGEMGMYDQPLDAYGRLLDEGASMAYLVIDTGIHYLGWSVAQARTVLGRYVLAPDAVLDTLITEQVIDQPGRAGAGALGAREVAAMRAWMQGEQGKDFSLRDWHAAFLSLGELPLPIVGSHLEWWLYDTARQRAAKAAAERAAAQEAAKASNAAAKGAKKKPA